MTAKKPLSIVYASEWESPREVTWSGTTYFLNKALQKISDVQEVDFTVSIPQKIIAKLSAAGIYDGKFTINKIPPTITRQYYKSMKKNYIREISKIDEDSIVFLVGCMDGFPGRYYTYQDLCFEALLDLKESGEEAFQYTRYQDLSLEDLEREAQNQARAYEKAAGVFTMGEWLAKFLVEKAGLPPEKVHFAGGGSNMDVSLIKPLREGNKFLFVGKQFENKGGPLICDAFSIVREKYMPEAELYIAGPQVQPEESKREGIHFLGQLPYEELVHYYNICDVFCMPSIFEAYGLVFGEALIFGLPCIGRRAFEMEYFIEDGKNGALLDETDSTEDAAKKMYNVITDETIIQYVAENREYYLKEYSWDTVAQRIVKVIEQDNRAYIE